MVGAVSHHRMGCDAWHRVVNHWCLGHDLGLVTAWQGAAPSNATISRKIRIRPRWHAHHQLDRCAVEFGTIICTDHIFARYAGLPESGSSGIGGPEPLWVRDF